jgi:hypothetical protein
VTISADEFGSVVLTIEEVADRLRVPVLIVRWLRQEGRFAPAIKVGRRLTWDTRDVAAWLEARRESVKVRVLGHASAAMTMELYGHLADGNLWQAARIVGGISGASEPSGRQDLDSDDPEAG